MSTTIFAGGLAYNITKSHMKSYFSKFGKIKKIDIARKKSGLSKGYGFVFFANESGVSNVLKLDHHEILGRKIDVQMAKERPQKEAYKQLVKKCRVFVGGLGPEVTDEELRMVFCSFGVVKSAYVIRDFYTKRSLGFGYVLFKDPRVAQILFEMKTMRIGEDLVTLSPYKFKEPRRKGGHRGGKGGQGCRDGGDVGEDRVVDGRKEEVANQREQRSGEGSRKSHSDQGNCRLREVVGALPGWVHGGRHRGCNKREEFDASFLAIFADYGGYERRDGYGEGNLRFNLKEEEPVCEESRVVESVEGGWSPFGFC